MLLTYKQTTELLGALMAIDGSIVTSEGSGEVRIKVAHNIKQLKGASDLAFETRKKVFAEMTKGENKISKEDEDLQQQVGVRMTEIDNTEVELKLWRIPFDKLKADSVPPKIIAALEMLLKDVPDLGEPDA